MKDAKALRAAGYIRMSSDKQDQSPARQRGDIERLAEQEKATIVGWYEDHGLTGTESKNRPDFQRLLRDAQAGKFNAILLSEQSRLSRETVLDAINHLTKLKSAGVEIITCQRGRLDLDGMGGVIAAVVDQYACHEESVKTSHRTTSGKRRKLQDGTASARQAFGYDREVTDPQGIVRHVHVSERFQVPQGQGWKVRLVPSTRAADVEAVRYAFRAFCAGNSMKSIARELDRRGVRTGDGCRIGTSMVKSILSNPVYIGTLRAGLSRVGKFNHLSEGHGPYIIANAHKGLVGEETFDKAQGILATMLPRRERGKTRRYLLSGLIVAEGCGCKMYGHHHTDKDRSYYSCHAHFEKRYGDMYEGRHAGIGCQPLDQFVLRILCEELARPRATTRLQAALALHARDLEADPALEAEETRLRAMAAMIERGEESLFKCLTDGDKETVAAMNKKLARLRTDHRELAEYLDAQRGTARVSPEMSDLLTLMKAGLEKLNGASWEILQRLVEAVVEKVVLKKRLVQGTLPRMVLERNGKPTNNLYRTKLVSGRIEFKPGFFSREVVEFDDTDIYPESQMTKAVAFVRRVGRSTTPEVAQAIKAEDGQAFRVLKRAALAGLITRSDNIRGGWIANERAHEFAASDRARAAAFVASKGRASTGQVATFLGVSRNTAYRVLMRATELGMLAHANHRFGGWLAGDAPAEERATLFDPTGDRERATAFVIEKGRATTGEVAAAIGVDAIRVGRLLKRAEMEGKIVHGKGRFSGWLAKESAA